MASTSEDSSGQESNKKTSVSVNSFVNDGSFFEMYKQKLKEAESTKDEKKEENSNEEKRKTTNLLLQVWITEIVFYESSIIVFCVLFRSL